MTSMLSILCAVKERVRHGSQRINSGTNDQGNDQVKLGLTCGRVAGDSNLVLSWSRGSRLSSSRPPLGALNNQLAREGVEREGEKGEGKKDNLQSTMASNTPKLTT